MSFHFSLSGLPLQDLIIGASIYLPPLFKALLPGIFLWLVLHRLLRDWMYSGEIWHPTLMDLSLFSLSLSAGLLIMIVW